MKNIEIKLFRKKIYSEVAISTAYMGAKQAFLSDPPEAGCGRNFDTVATAEDDDMLLSGYLSDAVSALTGRLKGYVCQVEFSGETLRILLSVSDSYDDTQTPALLNNITAYLTAVVTSRWFRLTLPAKAAEWELEGRRLLSEIVGAICHRKAPVRRITINI